MVRSTCNKSVDWAGSGTTILALRGFILNQPAPDIPCGIGAGVAADSGPINARFAPGRRYFLPMRALAYILTVLLAGFIGTAVLSRAGRLPCLKEK